MTQTSSQLGAGVEQASSRVVVELKGRLDMRLDSSCCVSWSLELTACVDSKPSASGKLRAGYIKGGGMIEGG